STRRFRGSDKPGRSAGAAPARGVSKGSYLLPRLGPLSLQSEFSSDRITPYTGGIGRLSNPKSQGICKRYGSARDNFVPRPKGAAPLFGLRSGAGVLAGKLHRDLGSFAYATRRASLLEEWPSGRRRRS